MHPGLHFRVSPSGAGTRAVQPLVSATLTRPMEKLLIAAKTLLLLGPMSFAVFVNQVEFRWDNSQVISTPLEIASPTGRDQVFRGVVLFVTIDMIGYQRRLLSLSSVAFPPLDNFPAPVTRMFPRADLPVQDKTVEVDHICFPRNGGKRVALHPNAFVDSHTATIRERVANVNT